MSWHGKLERIDNHRWRIPRSHKRCMHTDAVIFSSEEMLAAVMRDESLEQAANVACLPGIMGNSLAMPDIHWGYGFPIGGVAATDMEEGVISPGGIGFDINCGVRIIRSSLHREDLTPVVDGLADSLFKNVPSGLGSRSTERLSINELEEVLTLGSEWAVEKGFGWEEDLPHTENGGRMKDADPSKVGDKARKRGMPQLGSLGSGNHFVEVDFVDEVFNPELAAYLGLEKGTITVTVHCGSRGLGHQIATDYLKVMERSVRESGIELPDRQLACAPITSQEGKEYYEAMCCGANYAWANRQMITHWVRESFSKIFGKSAEDIEMKLVYDVAHNIAKIEEHTVDGKKRLGMVHRKGATRAFPAGHPELPSELRSKGQPVIIPGDMGTGTYVLMGQQGSMEKSFGSCCHGAGRVMSRKAAMSSISAESVRLTMKERGIVLRSGSKEGIIEEAPETYKDLDAVVDVVCNAGLASKVVRLHPLIVIKG